MNSKLNEKESEDYVPYNRAIKLFEPFGKNRFNYRARKKQFSTKKDKSGKKLYGVKSIIALRNTLLKETSRKDMLPEVIIDWLQPTDIPASLALDQMVYNEIFLAEADVYMAGEEKKPTFQWRRSMQEIEEHAMLTLVLSLFPKQLYLIFLLVKKMKKILHQMRFLLMINRESTLS